MRRSKFGVLAFLAAWFSFFTFSIVDDEGAGSDEPDDIGDFVIEDDDPVNEPDEKPDKAEPKEETKEPTDLEKQVEELRIFKEEQEAREATANAVAELSTKYPDFSADAVAKYLAEVAEKEGTEKADALNNPLGWENIYLTQFKKESSSEDALFDRGRFETKEPFDFKKGFEKAYSGDKDAVALLLENSKG